MTEHNVRNFNINFGPQHPAAHGVLRLVLERERERREAEGRARDGHAHDERLARAELQVEAAIEHELQVGHRERREEEQPDDELVLLRVELRGDDVDEKFVNVSENL